MNVSIKRNKEKKSANVFMKNSQENVHDVGVTDLVEVEPEAPAEVVAEHLDVGLVQVRRVELSGPALTPRRRILPNNIFFSNSLFHKK